MPCLYRSLVPDAAATTWRQLEADDAAIRRKAELAAFEHRATRLAWHLSTVTAERDELRLQVEGLRAELDATGAALILARSRQAHTAAAVEVMHGPVAAYGRRVARALRRRVRAFGRVGA